MILLRRSGNSVTNPNTFVFTSVCPALRAGVFIMFRYRGIYVHGSGNGKDEFEEFICVEMRGVRKSFMKCGVLEFREKFKFPEKEKHIKRDDERKKGRKMKWKRGKKKVKWRR